MDRRPPARSRPGLGTVALVFVAVLWTLGLVGLSIAEGLLAWDVRFAYLPAAEAVLDGELAVSGARRPDPRRSEGVRLPAAAPGRARAADAVSGRRRRRRSSRRPARARLGDAARVGVRDVRCYAAALLWMPTIERRAPLNVSIPLAFALALAWRYRDAVWPPAVALGLAVSAKLLLWPLFVWMLATRRLRRPRLAVAVGLAVTLGPGRRSASPGSRGYPDLLRRLSEIQSERSYSFVGMAAALGLPDGRPGADARSSAAPCSSPASCFARRGDDFRSFTCAVAATLALSPIVWLHYLFVLLVPLAIARPRFSLIWLLPVAALGEPEARLRGGRPDVPPGDRGDDPPRRAARRPRDRDREERRGGVPSAHRHRRRRPFERPEPVARLAGSRRSFSARSCRRSRSWSCSTTRSSTDGVAFDFRVFYVAAEAACAATRSIRPSTTRRSSTGGPTSIPR